MEALMLFDIDGLTAVVEINHLFDADGCSAVEAIQDLDKQFLKSSTWFVLDGGKRLLAEVLEIGGKSWFLHYYCIAWILVHRVKCVQISKDHDPRYQ